MRTRIAGGVLNGRYRSRDTSQTRQRTHTIPQFHCRAMRSLQLTRLGRCKLPIQDKKTWRPSRASRHSGRWVLRAVFPVDPDDAATTNSVFRPLELNVSRGRNSPLDCFADVPGSPHERPVARRYTSYSPLPSSKSLRCRGPHEERTFPSRWRWRPPRSASPAPTLPSPVPQPRPPRPMCGNHARSRRRRVTPCAHQYEVTRASGHRPADEDAKVPPPAPDVLDNQVL